MEKVPKFRMFKRDRAGRRRNGETSERALVEACLRSSVSVACMAHENGINASLMRKWITRYLLERGRVPGCAARPERVVEAESPGSPNEAAMPNVVTGMAPAPFVPIVPARPAEVAASSVQSITPSQALAMQVRWPMDTPFLPSIPTG